MEYLKPILSSLMLLSFCLTSQGQKVSLKRDTIYIDSKAVMKYKTNGWTSESRFYSLRSGDEIIHVRVDRSRYGGHVSIGFPQNSVSFDSRKILYGLSHKPFLKRLIREGVLTNEGEINYEKVQAFKDHYESVD